MSRTERQAKRPFILLVDGHLDKRQHLTHLLSEDYEIDAAADAQSALRFASKRTPDLVVMERTSQVDGGFDLSREFRKHGWGKVPVILYSTVCEEAACVNVIEDGANEYREAPFSDLQLLALVRAQLHVAQMRRESIDSLRLSEERFRTLKTMMTPGVWVSAPNGEVTGELAWWWEKLTGQTPEQYAGFGFLDVVHPDDKANVLEVRQHSLRTTTPYQMEFRIRLRDGSYRYVRIQGAPVRDGDGNVREWIGTLIDIDDHKRAEDDLRANEERLHAFLSMTALAVWTITPNGEVVSNYGWDELTGQTLEQSRGFGWMNALHPEDKPRVCESWQRALRDGTSIDSEYRVRRKDGTYHHVRNQVVPVRNSDGNVREWIGTVIDVEDQKVAEEALRAREEELRANFQLAGIGQTQTDPKTGRYLRVNNRYCEMLGYSRDELLTMTFLDVTHPYDRAAGRALLLGMLRHETDERTVERRYVRKDGTVMCGLVTTTLIRDAHHRPLRMISMIEDITERKQSQALSECQRVALEMVARGASLTDVLNVVILAVEKQASADLRASIRLLDKDGKHLRLCAAPSMPESYHRDEAVYSLSFRSPQTIAVSQKRPVIIKDLSAAPRWAKFGSRFSAYSIRAVWAAPIMSSNQEPLGSFCFYSRQPRVPDTAQRTMIQNVNQTVALAIERKQAETQRENLLSRERSAREQAEAANRVKDEFLAVVSHELRTPLNAINGWAYMLLNGSLDPATQSNALQSIRRQVRSQSQLIDDLLDVARIVSGKLRLDMREVDPSKVIAAAMDVVRPAAEAKHISLVAMLDHAASTVSADPERLQQVIWNLLSNAIKFTPEGGHVELCSRRADAAVEIVVTDTGQGISEDFLPYVFDRFRQADVSTTRTHGGIGLGLAIVRHLIELHGGSVFAESAGIGKGATFTIRLPLRAVGLTRSPIAPKKEPLEERRSSSPEVGEILKGRRVLLVEDNAEDREVLIAELAHHGASVTASASASEALSELDRARQDVLISDIGMPGEDGYSLIRKVRARPLDHGGLTPAIALTAYAGEANRKRALEAGYQEHMTKPADPNELVRAIDRLSRLPHM